MAFTALSLGKAAVYSWIQDMNESPTQMKRVNWRALFDVSCLLYVDRQIAEGGGYRSRDSVNVPSAPFSSSFPRYYFLCVEALFHELCRIRYFFDICSLASSLKSLCFGIFYLFSEFLEKSPACFYVTNWWTQQHFPYKDRCLLVNTKALIRQELRPLEANCAGFFAGNLWRIPYFSKSLVNPSEARKTFKKF
jgi:hypothetical protein